MRLKLLTLIAASLLAGCNDNATETVPTRAVASAPRVVVEPVAVLALRTRVEAVGTSRALRSISLFPATGDEVAAIHFKPGQYVSEGKLLVELDQRDEQLAVELAEVQLAEAERLYRRYRESADTGATLPTTLDAAKTALDAARIALNRARINLEDHSIEAPFAGHVGLTDIDPGDRVQPTTLITTLDDRSALLVSFDIPEVLTDKVRVGDEVEVSTWNTEATRSRGEVIEIDSRVNPETRTFTLRARVDNSDDLLRPGMSFRVTLNLEGQAYPVVPEIAVQWGAEGSYVWTVVDDRATRVPVEIRQRQKGTVLVKTALTHGDLVVVEGVQRLRPGAPVDTKIAVAGDPPVIPGGPG